MKKYIISISTLVLFVFFTAFNVEAAYSPAVCTSGQKTLVVHHLRLDGNYDNVGYYTWSNGNTGGSDGFYLKTKTDDFGAVYNVCLGTKELNGEGKAFVEIIPFKFLDNTGWDSAQKDTQGGSNLRIEVTELFAQGSTKTEQHVYFVQGGIDVLQVNEEYANAIVVYAAEDGDYDGWGMHTWSNNRPNVDWNAPLPFTATGYTTQFTFPVKVGAIEVDKNTANEWPTSIGFIVHKGDNKAYSGDINLDVTGIQTTMQKTFFYIKGADAPTTAANFNTTSNPYKFVFKFVEFDMTGEDGWTGTYAPHREAIRVVTSLSVPLRRTVDGVTSVIFKEYFFTLKQEDTIIPINVEIHATETSDTEFLITFENGYMLDSSLEYTLYFDNLLADDDLNKQKAEIVLALDTEAPVLEIVGDTVIEIDQYSKFEAFPDYVASDDRDGDITREVYVPVGKGKLDTSIVGDQIITLAVADNFGNITELEFTVRVKAVEVEEEKDLPLPLIFGGVGAVAVLGLVVFLVSKKFSTKNQ